MNFSLFVCVCDLFFLCRCWCSFVLQEQRQRVWLSGSLLVVDEVRTRDFQNTRPQELSASPFQRYDGCIGWLILILQPLQTFVELAKRLWKPGQSFILAGFILSLPRPDPCGSEHLFHRERPVATQHSLRNCVDHLAALSHTGYPIRCKFGLLCTLIDQSRGKDSITLRFFRCPGVFAIAMVSFSSLKFLTFAK